MSERDGVLNCRLRLARKPVARPGKGACPARILRNASTLVEESVGEDDPRFSRSRGVSPRMAIVGLPRLEDAFFWARRPGPLVANPEMRL
jgi:hypothetical protein